MLMPLLELGTFCGLLSRTWRSGLVPVWDVVLGLFVLVVLVLKGMER